MNWVGQYTAALKRRSGMATISHAPPARAGQGVCVPLGSALGLGRLLRVQLIGVADRLDFPGRLDRDTDPHLLHA